MDKKKPKKEREIYQVRCLKTCSTVDPEHYWEKDVEYVLQKEDFDKVIKNNNFKEVK